MSPTGSDEGSFLDGATVLITGVGRTAGRSVVRQAARQQPGRLLLLGSDGPGLTDLRDAVAVDAEVVVASLDDKSAIRDLLAEHRPDVVIHLVPPSEASGGSHDIDWATASGAPTEWFALAAAEFGCRHFLRVSNAGAVEPGLVGDPTSRHAPGGRHDPDTSDASLRAALENERANADHLRRLSRQQTEQLRRRLVRMALAVDKRAQRLGLEVTVRQGRLSRRVAKAELIASALANRSTVSRRWAELQAAIGDLPAPPTIDQLVSIIVVTEQPMRAAPRVNEGLAHELIVVLNGPNGTPPPGRDYVVVRSGYKTVTSAAASGAAKAKGELLCFLGPESDPLDDAWLARLAGAITGDTIASTPMLVHPERPLREATPHDLRIRELGLDMVTTDAAGPAVKAREAGGRARPQRPDVEVAAGSGACLVVDRRAFEEAGGLAPIGDFDAAIVDLCGRLRAGGGRVVSVPSSVVADHRPVASIRALTRPIDPESPGWRAVVDRQGPTLLQLARGDRVTEHLRIALTVAAPSVRVANQWGDWHLAQAMARSLRELGHSVHLQTANQADDPAGRSCDVHVVFRGLAPIKRTPGQRHVLWLISHPESLDIQECDDADLVLVASDRFAAALRQRTKTPVEVLYQATDPRRFQPRPPDPRHAHAVAVVAMTRHVFRPSVASALAVGLRPAIYGTGWEEFVDPDLIVADFIPNEQLPIVYSSVGVILNDHWDTMRAWGFVSNRLFDALACSTPIVSDYLPEVSELFGDSVAMYRDPDDLKHAVEAALDDPVAARRRATRGRQIVLDGHTFDHRARELLEALTRHGLHWPPR